MIGFPKVYSLDEIEETSLTCTMSPTYMPTEAVTGDVFPPTDDAGESDVIINWVHSTASTTVQFLK